MPELFKWDAYEKKYASLQDENGMNTLNISPRIIHYYYTFNKIK